MDFKIENIDKKMIRKGLVENLRLKISRLEYAAKRGFIGEFISAIIDYDIAREQVKDQKDCDKKVKEIFNYISSMSTDKYWTF